MVAPDIYHAAPDICHIAPDICHACAPDVCRGPGSVSGPHCRYGKQIFSLWEHPVSIDECRKTLKSIAGVAQDTIDRLSAEFREQDLHASFVALDLEAWRIAFAADNSGNSGSSTFTGPAYAKQSAMAGAIKRTFAALGMEFVAKEWRQVVLKALEIRERMLRDGEHVGASTPDEDRSWGRSHTRLQGQDVLRRGLKRFIVRRGSR